jgi:hypothetical protein
MLLLMFWRISHGTSGEACSAVDEGPLSIFLK